MLTPARLASVPMPIEFMPIAPWAPSLKYGPYSRLNSWISRTLRMGQGGPGWRWRDADSRMIRAIWRTAGARNESRTLFQKQQIASVDDLGCRRGSSRIPNSRASAASAGVDPLPDHPGLSAHAPLHASPAQWPWWPPRFKRPVISQALICMKPSGLPGGVG